MSIKQAIEALESCAPGDYSTGHVIHPSYDEEKVNAALAALRSMPAEPVGERDALIAKVGEEMTFEAWFKTMCPVDGINAKIAARAAWQAARTTSPPAPLSDAEIDALVFDGMSVKQLVRAIEQAISRASRGAK